MELEHHFTVPAPVGTTWDTFMDLAGVGSCFPGATVTSVEGDSFHGTVKVKLGPIALLYTGSGSFVTRDDAARRAVLEATGKDKRGNGTAGATVTIALDEAANDSTAVQVKTDLNVTGKPAQFGRGVMQDVSDKLLGQFVACLEQRLGTEPAEDGTSEAASEAAPAVESWKPAATPAAPAPTAPRPRPPNLDKPAFVRVHAGTGDGALDLGATVLPVLLRSYAPHLAAAAAGFLIGILVARRRR